MLVTDVTGHTLYRGRPDGTFEDVTDRGTALDDPQRSQEVFNTIQTSDRVTVTVERGGQKQDISLNIAQVAADATKELESDATAAPAGAPAPAPAAAAAPTEPAPPPPPPNNNNENSNQ